MAWLTTAEVVLVTITLLLLLCFLWLVVRRRLISRSGGTFDCSARLTTTTPSSGWVLGVARYSGEWLEWYRLFGLSLQPRFRWERRRTVVVGERPPTAGEAVALYDGQRVVVLEQRQTQRQPVEIAIGHDALTGLLAWLESAPPGLGRYGNVAD